jgi:hypothetical protein
MKRNALNAALPVHDYRPALQGALSWLGNRYLLAEPARPLGEKRAPFFTEKSRWHPPVVAGADRTPRVE